MYKCKKFMDDMIKKHNAERGKMAITAREIDNADEDSYTELGF